MHKSLRVKDGWPAVWDGIAIQAHGGQPGTVDGGATVGAGKQAWQLI